MTLYLTNGFSLNMLQPEIACSCRLTVREYRGTEAVVKGARSIVGHADMARLLGVPMHRETVQLGYDDQCIVAQYTGPRLPEGCTILPDGASIKLYFVTIEEDLR